MPKARKKRGKSRRTTRLQPGSSGGSFAVSDFVNPPGEFRPVPFWGLNDLLEDRELRRQIKEMKRQGWGGFFMHPRYGMETPYLSREYWDKIRTCIGEARRQGLQAWIYDEHPFPAGCAGGLVGASNPDFRHKVLVLRIHNRLTPIAEGVAYFSYAGKNGDLTNLKRIVNPERHQGSERAYLHFYEWTEAIQPSTHAGITNDFIHGFPYTDTLNPKAIRRFIELTYEGYQRAIGKEFGKTLKGAFSDIPVYQWHYATPHPSIPWTPDLPKYFRRHCGYDLLPHLPSLFFDVGDYARVRHDFWRVVNQRFLESYTKQVADWCERHGLLYTAHYWGEETLHWQIPWTGDVMSHFACQHVVSIDHILRNIEDPVGVKQASSVAEQLGKPRTISETYALCGHNLTYEERKWIGDWEFALGINMLVPYIPAYSYRGRRKRDEPPSEFFQQPYWEYEHLLNDYYGRLSYALTRGKQAVDILVLQPLASAWTLHRACSIVAPAYRPHTDAYEGAGVELFAFSQKFLDLCNQLSRAHRDYHLGNESLLADHAQVDGTTLRVGAMNYKAVIVPSSLNWQETTVSLLRKFAANGGTVIVQQPLPTLLDGRPARQPLVPRQAAIAGPEPEDVIKALGNVPPDVSIDGAEEVLYQHRQVDGGDIYFFANTSLKKDYGPTQVTIPGSGSLQLLDLLSGKCHELRHKRRGRNMEFELDFTPVSSYLLVRRNSSGGKLEVFHPLPRRRSGQQSFPLGTGWNIKRMDPNSLTLDYCDLQIGELPWSDRLPVWQAQLRIHQAGVGADFKLRFRFQVRDKPANLSVVVEDPKRYRVQFNGKPLPTRATGWRWDPHLQVFDVSSRVAKGENILELAGQCGIDTEVESCYVVGNFAVVRNGGFQITEEPGQVKGHNLVEEGYPFFVGRIKLTKRIDLPRPAQKAYLRFNRIDAIVARVNVNGRSAGHLVWKPYALDISGLLRPGGNTVEVDLCTSVHNLLGPHHRKQGEARHFVLQNCWTDLVNWTDEYFFVPVGIEGATIQFQPS